MESIEIRNLDIELSPYENTESDESALVVQGYIETSTPSHILGKENHKKWREIIAPGTFRNALAKAKRLEQHIDFLVDHNNKKILATTSNGSLFLEEDEVGLYIRSVISKTSWGQDLYVLVKDRIIQGLSFGMKVLQEDWEMTHDGLPLRIIKEIELFEISALKTPAYPATLLESRGLEVSDVKIPDEIEKRALVQESNVEITPTDMYNGMTLIAEKLDAILLKMDEIDQDRTVEGLKEAKEALTQATALMNNVSGNVDVEAKPDEVEKTALPGETLPPEEKVEGSEEEKAIIEEDSEEEKPADETEDEADEAEEVVDKENADESEEDEELTEEEIAIAKLKKSQGELRSWINENKIMEVPENE